MRITSKIISMISNQRQAKYVLNTTGVAHYVHLISLTACFFTFNVDNAFDISNNKFLIKYW